MQPTIQTSIPTISSVRRTADCLCAHDSVDVVMGSDFTRYCARLVIRIARSPSPVQRAAVSSYDFVVYVYDYTSGQYPARRDRELPAAQVLGYAEEQGLQGGYQVTLHS